MAMLASTANALNEHVEYLSDTHLLALLEMGLEETLQDMKHERHSMSFKDPDPINFLATWLIRHNPRHSKEGKEALERFAAEIGAREPLSDVGDLEERQQIDAAVRLQAASRGHAARIKAGEQKMSKAATRVQSTARGRAARRAREAEERKELDEAAIKIQATMRGNAERKAMEQQAAHDAAAQEAAATAVQAAVRGRNVRSAPAGRSSRGMDADEDEAVAYEAAGDAERAAAATKLQAIQRGKNSRSS